MAVAGQWFPANRFAILSGLAMAMGMAGGVFGQAPLRLAVEASDWRTATLLLAAGGVALAVAAIAATVRDRWRGSGGIDGCAVRPRASSLRQPPDLADRARRPWHLRAAARLRRPVGRAVPRDRLRAAAHDGRER